MISTLPTRLASPQKTVRRSNRNASPGKLRRSCGIEIIIFAIVVGRIVWMFC